MIVGISDFLFYFIYFILFYFLGKGWLWIEFEYAIVFGAWESLSVLEIFFFFVCNWWVGEFELRKWDVSCDLYIIFAKAFDYELWFIKW